MKNHKNSMVKCRIEGHSPYVSRIVIEDAELKAEIKKAMNQSIFQMQRRLRELELKFEKYSKKVKTQ